MVVGSFASQQKNMQFPMQSEEETTTGESSREKLNPFGVLSGTAFLEALFMFDHGNLVKYGPTVVDASKDKLL